MGKNETKFKEYLSRKARTLKGNSQNRGITLIALVVTIIVLLILAGVAIATLTGDNGVLTQSQNAANKTEIASFLEDANMAYSEIYAEKAERGENLTVSLEEVKARLIDENSSYKRTVHVVTNGAISGIRIKDSSGKLVGSSIEEESESCSAVELVKGIDSKEEANLTLEPVGGQTSYHAEIKGAFYEMKIENGQIKLTEESELPTGDITYTLSVTGGSNSTVITSTEQESKNITLTAGAKTGSPVQITVSYGMNAVVLVNVKGSYIVTANVDSSCTEKGTVAIDGTNPFEEGTTVTVIATPIDGWTFKEWSDGTNTYNSSGDYSNIGVTVAQDGTITYPIGTTAINLTAKFIEMPKPQVGDFVDYSAGIWTTADLEKLGVSFNNDKTAITNNGSLYTGGALPTSSDSYKFGGFTAFDADAGTNVIRSKDASVNADENSTNTYSGGWRILEMDSTETYITKIIHAGTPEGYYHPYGTNNGYKSQYILGGGINSSGTSAWDYNSISTRDWSMYVNSTYYGESATSVTLTQANDLFWTKTLLKTGSYYYYSNAGNKGTQLGFLSDNGWGNSNNCKGVRPVVTLEEGVKGTYTGSSTTHNTYENRWTLTK